jgi:hypothetical protein
MSASTNCRLARENGVVMIFAPLHLLIAIAPAAIGLWILYWVIRLAVRHGIRDSRK